VQDADQTELPANKAGILSQKLCCRCRGLKEQIIEKGLVRAGERAQGGGDGEGEHEVRHRQQKILLFLQPLLGFVVLTFRAVTVAAGVVAVLGLVALWAGIGLSTQGGGTALLDGAHDLSVAGEQAFGVLLAIGGTVLAEDVSQF
jgi:hypothetical protein